MSRRFRPVRAARARALGILAAGLLAVACGPGGDAGDAPPAAGSETAGAEGAAPPADPADAVASGGPDLPEGLLLALTQFEVGPDGKVVPRPGPARLEWVVRRDGRWQTGAVEDPDSNVFHKAFVYAPPGSPPGILTLGGNAAALKLWRAAPDGVAASTVWQAEFGGRFDRMRDAEQADLLGDGRPVLAVATHDQGVVALVVPEPDGSFEVREIDREPDTFVHEIEVGDLDGDGTLEVYATPSEPNKAGGGPQRGTVVRYVPGADEGRTVVADLGTRHAKEILVEDVDGDGRDELYVCVEAETEGSEREIRIVEPVEVRRFDADTEPTEGVTLARIDDRFCRFLTAGDVDGDGRKEMVAATFRSGVWLLRPGPDPKAPWVVEQVDADSSSFEHAALLVDLDEDGIDELYVAADDQGELRRYVWQDGKPVRETILRREAPGSVLTWNLMPVPVEMLPAEAPADPEGGADATAPESARDGASG